MKEHESVLVFSNGKHNYYPISRKGKEAEQSEQSIRIMQLKVKLER